MSTKSELQHIKSALAARPKGPGRRIPPELRRRIAGYARRRATEGAARVAVARELGIAEQTIVRALETSPDELLPIHVSGSVTATVRGPAGLTIEGLDIEGLAELIRALS